MLYDDMRVSEWVNKWIIEWMNEWVAHAFCYHLALTRIVHLFLRLMNPSIVSPCSMTSEARNRMLKILTFYVEIRRRLNIKTWNFGENKWSLPFSPLSLFPFPSSCFLLFPISLSLSFFPLPLPLSLKNINKVLIYNYYNFVIIIYN